jgi:type II secretory pathway pseudopilin PulG
MAAQVLSQAIRRDKEQQLLWVGHAYRAAIEAYVKKRGAYPTNLEALLGGPSGVLHERYLRQAYPDPITGSRQWNLIKAPSGGIMGVSSVSKKSPIKVARFDESDTDFETASTYADWKFVYDPATEKTEKSDKNSGSAKPPPR